MGLFVFLLLILVCYLHLLTFILFLNSTGIQNTKPQTIKQIKSKTSNKLSKKQGKKGKEEETFGRFNKRKHERQKFPPLPQ